MFVHLLIAISVTISTGHSQAIVECEQSEISLSSPRASIRGISAQVEGSGDRAIFAGGYYLEEATGSREYFSGDVDVFQLNEETNLFAQGAKRLPAGLGRRKHLSAVSSGNQVFTTGGKDVTGEGTNIVYSLNLYTHIWRNFTTDSYWVQDECVPSEYGDASEEDCGSRILLDDDYTFADYNTTVEEACDLEGDLSVCYPVPAHDSGPRRSGFVNSDGQRLRRYGQATVASRTSSVEYVAFVGGYDKFNSASNQYQYTRSDDVFIYACGEQWCNSETNADSGMAKHWIATDLREAASGVAVGAVGYKLIAAGGEGTSGLKDEIEYIDMRYPEQGSAVLNVKLRQARSKMTAIGFQSHGRDFVMLAGGLILNERSNRSPTDIVEILDITDPQNPTIGISHMLYPSANLQWAQVDNVILFGPNGNNTIMIYDTDFMDWGHWDIPNDASAIEEYAVAAVAGQDNKKVLLVAGGVEQNGPNVEISDKVQIYTCDVSRDIMVPLIAGSAAGGAVVLGLLGFFLCKCCSSKSSYEEIEDKLSEDNTPRSPVLAITYGRQEDSPKPHGSPLARATC